MAVFELDDIVPNDGTSLERIFQAVNNMSPLPDNIILMSGDSIVIPQKTGTASVVGAVLNPATTHLGNRRTVKDMIDIAGGFAQDADQEKGLVLRVNGIVVPARLVDYVEDGDIVGRRPVAEVRVLVHSQK